MRLQDQPPEAVKQKVLTISIPAASAVGAEAAAEREGTSVSQWVAEAIELRQRLEAGLDLLRRAEAEQGAAPRQSAAEARMPPTA